MKAIYISTIAVLLTQFSFAQPANDDCSNAENITVTTLSTTVGFDINTAVINNDVGCAGTAAEDYADVWYDFTMPVDGYLYVSSSISWNNFALYDACGGTEIQCGSNSQFFENLGSGTTYVLRVFRAANTASNSAFQSFTIQAFEEITNDACVSAEAITVTTSQSTVNFEIGGADINNEVGCGGTTADYADVWYDLTMPVDGNLYVAGSISWNNFALYDACGGTEIQCSSNSELFENLSAGTGYKLRVFRAVNTAPNTAFLSFTIQAFEVVPNDNCISAEAITVTTSQSTVNFEIGGADINNELGCLGTTAADYADVWYDLTMPVDGNLYVAGSIGWNNFALYDACGGTEIQCSGNSELFENLSAGTAYKLRVFRSVNTAPNTAFLSFTIQAFEDITNDDCANSENITVSTTASMVNFEIGGADINNEVGCLGTTADYADVWYDFVMPVNGNLYVDGSIGWTSFALYDACGGTEIQCGSSNQLFQNLSAGAAYKLRVFRALNTAPNTAFLSFTVQAFEVVSNDDCLSAETIAVTTSQSTVNFEIGGTDINNEVGCFGTTAADYADVWYDFVMPVNGNLYVDGSIGWTSFALYDTCGGTEIQCGSSNELFENLSSGTAYKLRVFRALNTASNTAFLSFTVQAFEVINNDTCALAETITVSDMPTTINFGIAGAAINNEVGCQGTPAEDYADIWYEFTMPEDGNISVDGSISWNNFALYDTCGGNEFGCVNNSGDFTGLVNGTEYKLRVFRALSTASNTAFKSFIIQVNNTLSVDDAILNDDITIYPNPVTNVLHVDSEVPLKALEMYDVNGRKILKQLDISTINVGALAQGIYVLKLISKNGTATKKIIKN